MHDKAAVAFCHLPKGQSAHGALDLAVAENLPASQAVQVSPAVTFCHLPAGQAAHGALDPSAAENMPASQAVQVALATAALKRPAAHDMHDEAAVASCHLPTGQAVHALDPTAAENLPASQAVQVALVAATARNCPVGQIDTMHDKAAVAFCHLPAGQAAHALDPAAAENLPASQSVQVALAALICATGAWRPAAHGVPVHGRSPLLECVPATQGTDAIHTSLPLHEPYAGQMVQLVRDTELTPPSVKEPEPHVWHSSAPLAAYRLLAPQTVNNATCRMAWSKTSATSATPDAASIAMPIGELKPAAPPTPSALPGP
jgi:hypothetical protein